MSDQARLAGILFPDVFQVDESINIMLETMKIGLSSSNDIFTHKNFQMGSIGRALVFNEKKTLAAALDGEIENTDALIGELVKKGYKISKNQKVLALLFAYEVWGESFLEKLEGSFALVLYDLKKELFLLARDRIGKKPLYWYQDDNNFIFASELKAILSTGIVPQTPAQDAISTYLYFGFIPQDLSPIKNVSKLLPGHYLIYNMRKGKTIRPYWSYSSYFAPKSSDSRDVINQKLSGFLERSTKELLSLEKGNHGCFISGGLGSATVAMEVSRLDPAAKAYTVGFQEQYTEDMIAAEEISDLLKMPQLKQEITPESLLDNLVEIVWHLDEPLADPNIAATWNICALAQKNGSQIVFSGMGSDEFLAGHNRYTNVEQDISHMSRLMMIPSPILKHVIIPFFYIFNRSLAYNILKVSRTNPWQFEFLRHNAVFNETQMKDLSPRLAPLFDPDTFLHRFHNLPQIQSIVDSLLYFDVKTRLPDHFIFQFEKLSKAHGLTWMTPFLNKDLVEYTASLPEPEFLSESLTASYLKPLIKDVFPEHIINRPKKTRRAFLNPWKKNPELFSVFKMLLKGTLVETGLISKTWLSNQLAHVENIPFNSLWSLLVLEIWFRLFINRPISQKPPKISVQELLSEG